MAYPLEFDELSIALGYAIGAPATAAPAASKWRLLRALWCWSSRDGWLWCVWLVVPSSSSSYVCTIDRGRFESIRLID